MFDELIKMASGQGIWVLLSCVLIIYILQVQEARDLKQEEREKNYQNIIQELTEKLNILDLMNTTINQIKDKLK